MPRVSPTDYYCPGCGEFHYFACGRPTRCPGCFTRLLTIEDLVPYYQREVSRSEQGESQEGEGEEGTAV